jgi:hypothetical protein
MRKNTDSHLKTRNVTVKKAFQGASSGTVLGAKKKGFVRTQELTFLVRCFWVF